MTTGIPKQPSFSSILLGIALVIVAFLAFLRLSDVVKYTGAALMYLPAKMGLIEMVMPQDVIPLSLAENPSSVTIPSPGQYILYLNNYALLAIHDAVVAGNTKPWIKIQSEELGSEVGITLIGRGLTWYDTPFAPGRPVVTFKIDHPGVYQVIHSARPDTAYLVPDTLTGKVSRITFWVLVELVLVGGVVFYTVRRRTASRRRQRLDIRAQNRARVDDTWDRIRKRKEEKRTDEDQPYWKKKQ
jgi:hypothetical protein